MHTYSICNYPEMTRDQDASRDEKENEIEWKPYIESYSIISVSLYTPTLCHPSDRHPFEHLC